MAADLNGCEFDAHGQRGMAEAIVVGGKFKAEAPASQIDQRRQMDRIERPKGNRERLQGALQDRAREIHKFNCFKKISCMLGYVRGMPKRVQAHENLVFKKPARNGRCRPQRVWWTTLFIEQRRKGDRSIKIDHRSSRSAARPCIRSSNVASDIEAGGEALWRFARVTMPSRASCARTSPALVGNAGARGGTSSAMTLPRSVTSTVSPACAART
jgi:hypothetical protein